MIILVSVLTTLAIASCVMKYKNTKSYIDFKRSKSFMNFVISKTEIGDYHVVNYMCRGKIYSYIQPIDDESLYSKTNELSNQEKSNKHIVFATFVTPTNNNFQIVTKKIRKFAGLDGSFYNWNETPLYIRRKVLKTPKEATAIRLIYGNGDIDILELSEKQD